MTAKSILQSILGTFYRDQTFQFLEEFCRGVQVANLPDRVSVGSLPQRDLAALATAAAVWAWPPVGFR